MKTHANSNINCCSCSWSRCGGVGGGLWYSEYRTLFCEDGLISISVRAFKIP